MLRLSVESDNPTSDLEDLAEWLGQEPELRGLISDEASKPKPGELGTAIDVLVAAVGSGGALTMLITSLQAYLSTRGTDLAIKITGRNGRTLSIDAKRTKDPEALLRWAREAADSEDGDSGGAAVPVAR